MTTGFGCVRCYGEDAPAVAAYNRKRGLETEQNLIYEPHFVVSVRRCRECGQQFVDVFSEFVNWSGGEDSYEGVVVPVTPAEAATVIAQGRGVDLAYLGSLGEGRRRLSTYGPGRDPARWIPGPFGIRQGH